MIKPIIKYSALLFSASAALLAGCGGGGSDSVPSQITFSARVNGEAAHCGVRYTNVGQTGASMELMDFRLYISNIVLIRADGSEVPVELVEDGLWQFDNMAMLDFEDATGACAELGTPQTNRVVNFTAPEGDYVAARFTLGVPFEHNHGNSSTAPSPLNLGAMQWNWQAGYKFARIDIMNDNPAPNNRWFFHLGSTGCQSESNVTAPATQCSRPNSVSVLLEDFTAGSNQVVIDVGQFLSNVDIDFNTPDTLPGCMSVPTDPECGGVFEALGLSLQTGSTASDCSNCQQLFHVE